MLATLAFGSSLALFIGMVQNLLAMQKPGIYPSKNMLKRRAEGLAKAGTVCLLIGVILSLF